MDIRALAAGNTVSRTVATQLPENKEDDANIRRKYALPRGGGAQVISTLFSEGKFEYTADYAITHLAIAATKIAADLVMTAVAYQNLDNFAKSSSKRVHLRRS